MSTTIQEQLQILEETKAQIKQALIDKKIEVIDTDSFRSYADKIDNYTSDATAKATDIAEDKVAYVDGEKVVGTIPILGNGRGKAYTEDITMFKTSTNSETQMDVMVYIDADILLRYHSRIYLRLDNSYIASVIGLTSDMLLEGNTVLGIEGTASSTENLQAQLDAQDALIAQQAAQIEELKSLIGDKASNISSETIETVNEILGNEEV